MTTVDRIFTNYHTAVQLVHKTCTNNHLTTMTNSNKAIFGSWNDTVTLVYECHVTRKLSCTHTSSSLFFCSNISFICLVLSDTMERCFSLVSRWSCLLEFRKENIKETGVSYFQFSYRCFRSVVRKEEEKRGTKLWMMGIKNSETELNTAR